MITATQAEIAATTARLVIEEGLEWGIAKHRAVRILGLPQRTPLPDNAAIDDAVREYIALFCAETQPHELQALRELALVWMDRLSDFRPYVAGAVWGGTATRLSDIYLQLFCDDPKSAEIALIDRRVDYDIQTVQGFHGAPVDALSMSCVCPGLNEVVGVHLMIYDHDDLKGALREDARGKTHRGSAAALRQRMLEVKNTQ